MPEQHLANQPTVQVRTNAARRNDVLKEALVKPCSTSAKGRKYDKFSPPYHPHYGRPEVITGKPPHQHELMLSRQSLASKST